MRIPPQVDAASLHPTNRADPPESYQTDAWDPAPVVRQIRALSNHRHLFHQSDSRAHPVGSDVQRGAQAHLAGPAVTQVLSRAKKRRWWKQGSRIPTHSDRPRHPRSPLIEQNMQRWRGVGTNCFPQGTITRHLSRGMKTATFEGRGSLP